MKNLSIIAILTLSACSSVEDITYNYPYISNLTNTECLSSHTDTYNRDSDTGNGTFEMTLKERTGICRFTSLDYPCDFGKVNIKVSYADGVLKIVEYPSSDNADCRCETDASFIIENIPDNDFILKIYHADMNGKFNENNPTYTGKVNLVDGGLSIPY